MLKTIEIDLLYQPLIDAPPQQVGNLYSQACSGDEVTINAWRETWIKQYKENRDRFQGFGDKSIGQLHGINHQKPAIILGSGPSLKNSIEALKENKESLNPVLTVSCLHNFGFLEDEGCHADYYLSIDAGKIVIDDVSEGRKENADYYWEKTKGKKLLAYVASDPRLFDLWQGEVYLYNCLIPDLGVKAELEKVERFAHYVSCGGNALGGCLYVAKAIMGSDAIHFVGADFCFDYNNTFHSYKTHYDSPGDYVILPDVYGIPRKSWRSYTNFKFWFDHIAMNVPGRWVNCSEGILGAYPGGNLKHFEYKSLKEALLPYQMNERVFLERRDAKQELLGKDRINLKDLFSNPNFEQDIILF